MINADRSSTTRNKNIAGQEMSKASRINSSKDYKVFSSHSENVYKIIGDLATSNKTLVGIVNYEGTGSTEGSPPLEQKIYNATFTPQGNNSLVKTGFRLVGWNVLPDTSVSTYIPGQYYPSLPELILYPVWAPTYRVTYQATGTTGNLPVDLYEYIENEVVNIPAYRNEFQQSGAAFLEWNDKADGSGRTYLAGTTLVMKSEPVLLYAIWESIFTVTYVGGGATSGVPSTTDRYASGGIHRILSSTNMVRNGYRFVQWSVSDGRIGNSGDDIDIQANTTFTAIWIQTFQITYDGNGYPGSYVPTDPRKYDMGTDAPIITINPTRYKYQYRGWNTDPEATSGLTATTITMDSDKTLFAIWEELFIVTYVGGDGTTGNPPQDTGFYHSGDFFAVQFPLESDPNKIKKQNHEFLGWNRLANQLAPETLPLDNRIQIYTDITFRAVWEKLYTVTYIKRNGETGTLPVDPKSPYHDGDPVTVSTVEIGRSGFRQDGWNRDPNATTSETSFLIDGEDVNLYAVWKEQKTVRYYGNGFIRELIAEELYDVGQPVEIKDLGSAYIQTIDDLINPQTSFRFTGWNEDDDALLGNYQRGGVITASEFTRDFNFYAIWVELCPVTYYGNGSEEGSVPEDEFSPYDKDTPNVPVLGNSGALSKRGHSFDGWNLTAVYKSTADYSVGDTFTITTPINLYANFELNSYQLLYSPTDTNGGTPVTETESYLYGTSIPDIKGRGTLYKNGYTFKEWRNTADDKRYKVGLISLSAPNTLVMSDAGIVLESVWDQDHYTITYSPAGGSGTLPTEPNTYTWGTYAPVRSLPNGSGDTLLNQFGYTFAGWTFGTQVYNYPNTVQIFENSTFLATWTPIQYGLRYMSGITGTTGSQTDTGTYTIGTNATIKDKGTYNKSGTEFKAWCLNKNGSGGFYYPTGLDYSRTVMFNQTNITEYATDNQIQLYAIWTCDLTYSSNDGTDESDVNTLIHYENSDEKITLPSPDYPDSENQDISTLDGWYTEIGGTRTYYAGGDLYPLTTDTTFYARWKCSVTYNTLDYTSGTYPTQTYCDLGLTHTILAGSLVRTNYTFGGWYTLDSEDNKTYYPVGYVLTITSNTTFYPIWACSVTYAKNGASVGNVPVDNHQLTYSVTFPNTLTPPTGIYFVDEEVPLQYNTTVPILALTNNTFSGWKCVDADGTTIKTEGATYPIKKNTIINARWTCTLTYSVTVEGGTAPSPVTYDTGDFVTLTTPTNPYGYTFVRWLNGSTPAVDFNITGNTTLTSEWDPITYYVTYYPGTGTGISFSTSDAYNTRRNIQTEDNLDANGNSIFTKDGANNRFMGWSTLMDSTTVEYSAEATLFAYGANINLYAVWAPTYRIRAYSNLDAYPSVVVRLSVYAIVGETRIVSDPSTLTTHQFVGWNTNPDESGTSYPSSPQIQITEDIVYTTESGARYIDIYAVWNCTITYKDLSSDVTYSTDTQRMNASFTVYDPTTVPTKTGNTFDGWYYLVGTTITEYSLSSPTEPRTENGYTIIRKSFTDTFTVTANSILYASWICTATFDLNTVTGTIPSISRYNNNGRNVVNFPDISNLIPAGKHLDTNQWYYGASKTEASSLAITQDTTIYANWKYRVYYDVNGGEGTVDPSSLIKINESFTVTATEPVYVGYTLTGWQLTPPNSTTYLPGSTYPATGDAAVTSDITLTAKWGTNYVVRIDPNNGSEIYQYSTTYRMTPPYGRLDVGTLQIPSYVGHNFVNWKNPSGTVVSGQQTINDNITYTAQWLRHTYTISYSIPAAYTGYLGTLPNGSTGVPYDSSYNVSSNVITYRPPLQKVSHWKYTPTSSYAVQGSAVSTEIGTAFRVPALTTNLGTIALTPTFANAYTATYSGGVDSTGLGTIYGSLTDLSSPYVSGKTVTTLASPFDLSGHTFNTWQLSGTTTNYTPNSDYSNISRDISFVALWTKNTYTVRYIFPSEYNITGNITSVDSGSSFKTETYGNTHRIRTSFDPSPLTATSNNGANNYVLSKWQYKVGSETSASIDVVSLEVLVINNIFIYPVFVGTYTIEYADDTSVTRELGGELPTTIITSSGTSTAVYDMLFPGGTYTIPSTTSLYGRLTTSSTIKKISNNSWQSGSPFTLTDNIIIRPIWTNAYTITYDLGGVTSSSALPTTIINSSGTPLAVSTNYFPAGSYRVPDTATLTGTLSGQPPQTSSTWKINTTPINGPFTLSSNITITPVWVSSAFTVNISSTALDSGSGTLPTTLINATSQDIPLTGTFFNPGDMYTIPSATLTRTLSGQKQISINSWQAYQTTAGAGTAADITNTFAIPSYNMTIIPKWTNMYSLRYDRNNVTLTSPSALPIYVTAPEIRTTVSGSSVITNSPSTQLVVSGGYFIQGDTYTIPTITLIGSLSGVTKFSNSWKAYNTSALASTAAAITNPFAIPANNTTIIPNWLDGITVTYDSSGVTLDRGYSLPTTLIDVSSSLPVALSTKFIGGYTYKVPTLTTPNANLGGITSVAFSGINSGVNVCSIGWYRSPNATIIDNSNFSMPSSNITIYPRWSSAFKVTYALNNGYSHFIPTEIAPSEYVTSGTQITLPQTKYVVNLNSTNLKYIFTKWGPSYNNIFNTENRPYTTVDNRVTITSNINFTSSTFVRAYLASYKVYNIDISNLIPTDYHYYTSTMYFNLPTNIIYNNANISGWDDISGGSENVDSPRRITSDTTFYAILSYPLIYESNNGESETYTRYYPLGNATLDIYPPDTFTPPTGKQFRGWSKTVGGPKVTDYNITSGTNTNVFARWETGVELTYSSVFRSPELTYSPSISISPEYYTVGETVNPIKDLSYVTTTYKSGQRFGFPQTSVFDPSHSYLNLDIENDNDTRIFTGWSDISSWGLVTPTQPATILPGITFTITSNRTLYMCWSPKCVLSFTNNNEETGVYSGSGSYAQVTSYYGNTVNLTPAISSFRKSITSGDIPRTGFHYPCEISYYRNNTGLSEATTSLNMPHPINLTYTMCRATVTACMRYAAGVIYHINGGSLISPATLPITIGYISNSTVNIVNMTSQQISAPATKTYAGWINSLGSDLTFYSKTGSHSFTMEHNQEVTLYAAYTPKFKITYSVNGGTVGNTAPSDGVDYYHNCTPTTKTQGSYTYSPYNFKEWNTRSDASGGTSYGENVVMNSLTGATTLYAMWETTIQFNRGSATTGSPSFSSMTQIVSKKLGTLPTKSSMSNGTKTFIGWNTATGQASSNRTEGTTYTYASNPVIFYAAWGSQYTLYVTCVPAARGQRDGEDDYVIASDYPTFTYGDNTDITVTSSGIIAIPNWESATLTAFTNTNNWTTNNRVSLSLTVYEDNIIKLPGAGNIRKEPSSFTGWYERYSDKVFQQNTKFRMPSRNVYLYWTYLETGNDYSDTTTIYEMPDTWPNSSTR